jgi:hypothetical protein
MVDEDRKLELKMPFLGIASLCQVIVDETVPRSTDEID